MDLKVSSAFKKDYRKCRKRGLDTGLLTGVTDLLLRGEKLPPGYYDHQLTGKYRGFRECHIAADWLLIYRIDK